MARRSEEYRDLDSYRGRLADLSMDEVRDVLQRLLRRIGGSAGTGLPGWSVGLHPGAERSPVAMHFSPEAFQTMLGEIGTRPPETGAKGFGPLNGQGFEIVEFDRSGSSTASGGIYRPDAIWGESRRLHHQAHGQRVWTGDIHSHPGDFGRPSRRAGRGLGDLGYVEEVFAMNEWLEWFFIPILTGCGTGHVVIHPWVVRRGAVDRPMIADLVIGPVGLFPKREFNPEWERGLKSGRAESVPAEGEPEPETAGEEPSGPPADEEKGTAVAGRPVAPEPPAAIPVPAVAAKWDEQLYRSRLAGIVSDRFRKMTILAVGIGAGSYAVEKLARLGPARLILIDPDRVELHNLTRTAYGLADVGRTKVEALKGRIEAINPFVKVIAHPSDITLLKRAGLDRLFDGVDLVIAGTDRFDAQALINRESVGRRIPSLFVGVHAFGRGGRVCWYLPGETGCYRCVAPERFAAAGNGSGKVDLDGATGSLIDVQFIDAVALKVAVAILERGADTEFGRFLRGDAVRRNEVVVRCHPDHAWGNQVWDAMLADLPREPRDLGRELREQALLAMDTLWLQGRRDPDCPVCGRLAAAGGAGT